MAADEMSEQLPSDRPITHRVVANRNDLDAIDRLLVVSCEIPSSATIEQAAHELVSTAAKFLDHVAIGAIIHEGEGARVIVRSVSRDSAGEYRPGAPMFPELACEDQMTIGLDEGSTLHFAADDKERVGDPSVRALLERLALALGAAVRRCRAYNRTQKLSKDVEHLKAQIIQADKLASIGQMVAGIVHELNNPLTSIVAISDFLRKRAKEKGDGGDLEKLNRIAEAAERILDFSRSLTDFSRPARESFGPVPIHDIIDRALVFCAHEIEVSDIEVRREYAASASVFGITGKLTQVFVNLLTNAAHAMRRDGGRLIIRTDLSRGGNWVTISVADEGHGIAEDHLPELFNPFFTTKTDGTGTGLGLSIVRNIVQEHRGQIRAERRSPKGAIFYVDLPAAT